ncbi:MAG TPA: invasin domain 3-containing protein [Chitinophagaceae bacterium]|nr:invasin domain 3-containing protein [Chitinophagaceae bacterium]HPH32902.1 invasin domain 3-containing protein [Chitinophagaceae bacterium]
MKSVSILFTISIFTCLCNSSAIYAQCNVNEKYDKVVSGYHQSIALKNDGTFAVWGQDLNNAGTGDLLTPVNITVANFAALTGTPLKATIGGAGGSGKEQAILLTSTGLFAWGTEGYVVANSLTSNAAFQKIGTPTGGDGTTKLPSGVAPADVLQMTASYQTLILLTTGGNVWILTQSSANMQGNGAAAATTTWHQVKKNASTVLSGVTAVRGQVSNSTYGAVMALCSNGEVYAWGNSVYLGNGTNSAAKNYATLMTLPAEFTSSNIPKMIGVTGGVKGTSTVKNTFYLVSNLGSLYALGDNTKKQCGTFNTTEQKSWVKAKVNSTTEFNNISYISVQEHDASYPGVAAITTTGNLYTWGENDGMMLGRTTDGSTYDPGFPGGFTSGTDKAVSVEVGGHTLVYLREGSAQFCYVGHKVGGSMGDNTGTDTNVNTFNCSGTPNISICGYVPVAASAITSAISVAQSLITANGISTTTITIRLKDASGTNLTTSGGTITLTSSAGTLGTVVDNNDGTYTVILTSTSSPATALIGFAINGTTASNTTSVVFANTLPLKWGDAKAFRKYKTQQLEWITEQETMVSHFEVERSINGRDWSVILAHKNATNGDLMHTYTHTDNEYIPGVVYYRIKEVDKDGKSYYSAVLMVEADAGFNRIIAYPNPADKLLYIGNVEKSKLSNIQLFSINGEKIKEWNQPQISYDVSNIPTGIYLLKVNTTDGAQQTIRIKKI